MDEVSISINGEEVRVKRGMTVLEAASESGVHIPTLCYLKDICEDSNCRICMVENTANGRLIPACNTMVFEGLSIETASETVKKARRQTLKLILSNHHKDCSNCEKDQRCKLQDLCEEYEIADFADKKREKFKIDCSSPCIVRNNNKCIVCSRCISMCGRVQAVAALTKLNRGIKTKVGCAFDAGMKHSTCVGCGQCTLVCPTGALVQKGEIPNVKRLLADKNNFVVAQVAPSVRVALSENFGHEVGTFDEGKLAACLKALGFNKVFDVTMGADFTAYEETLELIGRVREGKNLPIFSSCCPAWHKYVQTFYPNNKGNLSTCKSPTEMLGAVIKNYYAKKNNVKNVKVVGIMPCTAKKGEKLRGHDVDAVLTTREIAKMIKEAGIDFNKIRPSTFDTPFSKYSGAGLIFGATGGVTEAVLRYALELLSHKPLKSVEFETVRKSSGVKEVEVQGGGITLKLCVVNGLANAKKVMDKVNAGKAHYHFMEVMACPGGCVNGGGQTYSNYDKLSVSEIIAARAASLYKQDKKMKLRKPQENSEMNEVYKQFFVPSPNKTHEILHHHRIDGKFDY